MKTPTIAQVIKAAGVDDLEALEALEAFQISDACERAFDEANCAQTDYVFERAVEWAEDATLAVLVGDPFPTYIL